VRNISNRRIVFRSSTILIVPNQLSDDQQLESKYYQDPDVCDLSELIVVENIISGRKDIVALFWENKLGVDVEVRILPFKYLAMISTRTGQLSHRRI
jgi:hypothetical protein